MRELPSRGSVLPGVGRRLVVCAVLALLAAACGDRLAASGGPSASPSLLPAPVPVPLPSVASTALQTVSPLGSGSATAGTAVSGTAIVVTPRPSGAPAPTPVSTVPRTPSPTIAGSLPLAQLKYRLVDRFGRLWFCDPDFYPVARADEGALAEQRFAEIQQDADTFAAILAHLGIPPSASYTHDQKLAVYRDWKMLNALQLTPTGTVYHFTARFTPDGLTGSLVDGSVDGAGGIAVASQTPSGPPPCPICLARGTRIATPDGSVAVEDVRAGMVVWTANLEGQRVAAAVIAVGSMTAPADHEVVRLVLADGRELRASPSHPLADGRPLGTLRAGDSVDGSVVLVAERLPYPSGATFDLLPGGATGIYWADGIRLASTIHP